MVQRFSRIIEEWCKPCEESKNKLQWHYCFKEAEGRKHRMFRAVEGKKKFHCILGAV